MGSISSPAPILRAGVAVVAVVVSVEITLLQGLMRPNILSRPPPVILSLTGHTEKQARSKEIATEEPGGVLAI